MADASEGVGAGPAGATGVTGDQPRPARPEQRPFGPHHAGRTRVLVETADRALLASDFRFLGDAGFDVAVCAGPGDDPARCPLLRGQGCELVSRADVVLHALGPDRRVVAAVRAARPDLPVLVERPRWHDAPPEPLPDGCVPLDMPGSLQAQLVAVRHAAGR